MRKILLLCLVLIAASMSAFFLGCSGSGASSASLTQASQTKTGKMSFKVQWPTKRSARIPTATQSIQVSIAGTNSYQTSQVINRPAGSGPTSTITFAQLPIGLVTVTAIAYPSAGAVGTAQASGQANATIIASQTATVTVTLNSTITSLVLFSPVGVITPAGTVQLAATPYDINGHVVLVAPGDIHFVSGNPAVATVNAASGLVTAVADGTVTMQAIETDSGIRSNVISLLVTDQGGLIVTIVDAGLRPYYTLAVNAVNGIVTQSPNQSLYYAASSTVVSLTAVPDTGYSFSGWSGSLSGTTNPTTITMTANMIVTANFAVISHMGPAPINLNSANSFAILAGSAITNTGASVISGNVGESPGLAVTGFSPVTLTGTIFTAPDAGVSLAAQTDLSNAYGIAAGLSAGAITEASGELGGLTLVPGLYQSGISSFAITTGNLTLDAQGDPTAVWVLQMPSSSLTVGTVALGRSVVFKNGIGNANNVYWQVGSSATIYPSSVVVGNILALTSITLNTGATLNGRALAQNGAVTLNTDTISTP